MIRLQIYIISFFVLLIIYIQLREESQSYSLKDSLFRYLILATMGALVFEAVSWSANGAPGRTAYVVNMTANMLLLMTDAVPLILWTLYIIAMVSTDQKRISKWFLILSIPVVSNIIIALSTPINGKYFYIDENNLYHRGEWLAIGVAIHWMLFIINVVVILRNWKKINYRNRVTMLLFIVPPMIGFVVQFMFYGTSLIWPGATISILMGYVMIQSQMVKQDYLTGLYNRRQLDIYLDRKIRNLPKHKKFAGMIIDLDDFKLINDQYGHAVGDQAIKKAASLINKSCRREDFVARYGGDEFTVILDVKDEKELRYRTDNLERHFEQFNNKNEEVYKLSISLGCGIYSQGDGRADEFLHSLDQRMYQNKKKKKTMHHQEIKKRGQ